MSSAQNQNSSIPGYREHELVDSHDPGAGLRFFDAHDPAISLDIANHNRGNMEITVNADTSAPFNLSVRDRRAAARMIAGPGTAVEAGQLVQLQALAAELSEEVSTDYMAEWERGNTAGTITAGKRLTRILNETDVSSLYMDELERADAQRVVHIEATAEQWATIKEIVGTRAPFLTRANGLDLRLLHTRDDEAVELYLIHANGSYTYETLNGLGQGWSSYDQQGNPTE